MNIYQIVLYTLAVIFGIAGFIKLKFSKKKLAKSMPWTREFKPATIQFIGLFELLGALGLIIPTIIRTGYGLVTYAALGLGLIMILAGIYHSRRKEWASLIINFILLLLCLSISFNMFPK